MKNKPHKLLTNLIFLIIPESQTFCTTYTATKNSSGANYSVDRFNAQTRSCPNGTFKFSRAITSKITITINGSSNGHFIPDGSSVTINYSGYWTRGLTDIQGKNNTIRKFTQWNFYNGDVIYQGIFFSILNKKIDNKSLLSNKMILLD